MPFPRRKKVPGKLLWNGFRIVRLPETGKRECTRYWSDGRLKAIIQKNGNVAVGGTGIFDRFRTNGSASLADARVARCLHGLNMVSEEFKNRFIKAAAAIERARDIESLESDAERLGFHLVQTTIRS